MIFISSLRQYIFVLLSILTIISFLFLGTTDASIKTDYEIVEGCFNLPATGDCVNANLDGVGQFIGGQDLTVLRSLVKYDLNVNGTVEYKEGVSGSDIDIALGCFNKEVTGECAGANFDGVGQFVGGPDITALRSTIKYDLNGNGKVEYKQSMCGDVNNDGFISKADSDLILGSLLVPPTAMLTNPDKCDVGGSIGCTSADSVIILRSLLNPPTATIIQQCNAVAGKLTIISPNGGETVNISQPFEVILNTTFPYPAKHYINLTDIVNGTAYSLDSLLGSYGLSFTSEQIKQSNQSLIFKIPESYNVKVGDKFKIEICVNDICYYSDSNFSVVNVPYLPVSSKIVLNSPPEFQKYVKGDPITVGWTVPPTHRVGVWAISLEPNDKSLSSNEIFLYGMKAPGVAGEPTLWESGTKTLKLPNDSYLIPGLYKLKIWVTTDGIADLGVADSRFITIATVQTTPEKPVMHRYGTFTRNLWRGMSGEDVRKLQALLGVTPQSGYFGAVTEAAVQNFQCKYTIACSGTPDSNGYGLVGPKTIQKLNEVYGNIGTQTTSPSQSNSNNPPSQTTPSSGKSGLSTSQINAIIGLLEAFGADATIIANVREAL